MHSNQYTNIFPNQDTSIQLYVKEQYNFNWALKWSMVPGSQYSWLLPIKVYTCRIQLKCVVREHRS